ncbi:MAG: PglZ domain-containing protein [Chloroflexi bacterium]|nr:PglZ domain-containing protein [Chloroflexota bacterium]
MFKTLLARLARPDRVLVSAGESLLRARREADAAYRRLDEADGVNGARRNLLVYVPVARGRTPEEQQVDPFEAFARCGAVFGDHEGERLASLAQQALPDHAAEIARLFREGRPTLELLDALPPEARFPLVRQALGTDAPVETVVAALSWPDTGERLAQVPAALGELARIAERELGLPARATDSWPALRDRIAQYLLVSELAFDLPSGLPDSLATVAHAGEIHRQRVLECCDRLRESDAGRDAYVELARRVERDLRLPGALGPAPQLGSRDTFSWQERQRLSMVVERVKAGDLAAARALLAEGERSVWRREAERDALWRAAQHGLAFLELAREVEGRALPQKVRGLVEAYVAADGVWRLDRAQRRYEHAAALCAQDDEIEPVIQVCRERYRAVAERIQGQFQDAVKAEGWPPEGVRRQTQTFDRYVDPELKERRKTAYFLVDSLRYEMGRDLVDALQDLGAMAIEAATSVLPTTTPCGMAALLPGADGALTLVEQRGDLVPAVGGTPLPGVNERKALLAERFGDRFFDTTLGDVLSWSQQRLGSRIGTADFVVVRTQDIDAFGEGFSSYQARKIMSEVIGDLRQAAMRLASLGFQTLVFASDHGHVFVPEALAGEVVSPPAGEWIAKKRRSLLGRAQASAPGVLVLRAHDMGIVGGADDFAVASGFKTFQAGTEYFHEGLSLQECVLPVVVVRAHKPQATAGGEQVTISYRRDRFTSSMVGLKVLLTAMFADSLRVRVEAFDGTGPKARALGQAGDCDARDPATGEIVLRSGEETQVPLVIDPDFAGRQVEVRAIDPRTGAMLHRLTLKNARLD